MFKFKIYINSIKIILLIAARFTIKQFSTLIPITLTFIKWLRPEINQNTLSSLILANEFESPIVGLLLIGVANLFATHVRFLQTSLQVQ